MFSFNKVSGLILALGVFTIISFAFSGINIPIPSAYIPLMITSNSIFAFFSIFTQRLVIALYEVNVDEEKNSVWDYLFKYVAIFTSGINYYVQNVLNRLPLLLNKLLAIFFFLFLVWIGFCTLGIFN